MFSAVNTGGLSRPVSDRACQTVPDRACQACFRSRMSGLFQIAHVRHVSDRACQASEIVRFRPVSDVHVKTVSDRACQACFR